MSYPEDDSARLALLRGDSNPYEVQHNQASEDQKLAYPQIQSYQNVPPVGKPVQPQYGYPAYQPMGPAPAPAYYAPPQYPPPSPYNQPPAYQQKPTYPPPSYSPQPVYGTKPTYPPAQSPTFPPIQPGYPHQPPYTGQPIYPPQPNQPYQPPRQNPIDKGQSNKTIPQLTHSSPGYIFCRNCHAEHHPVQKYQMGCVAWSWCCCLLLTTAVLWPIPMCSKNCKDQHVKCEKCGFEVFTKKARCC